MLGKRKIGWSAMGDMGELMDQGLRIAMSVGDRHRCIEYMNGNFGTVGASRTCSFTPRSGHGRVG